MNPTIIADSPPATPMIALPRVKAAIFHRPIEIPKQAAAVSSSRTASSATPSHERSTPRTSRTASSARAMRREAVEGVTREVQAEEPPVVVEAPPEDLEPAELEPLRAAERVVHLEEGAEEKPEGDGDQRCVVAPGPEQGQQKQRAHPGGDGAAGEQDQGCGSAPRASTAAV